MLLTPALAASTNSKYVHIYNAVNGTYTSVKNIAGAHDKWVGSHHGNCARGQVNKWWEKKYSKDVNAVKAAEKKLESIGKKAREHSARTYSDFARTFKDLVGWMDGKIEPRLLSCREMPKKSQKVEADLQTLQNDLGIIPYG